MLSLNRFAAMMSNRHILVFMLLLIIGGQAHNLQFHQNNTFKIVQFTDLHFGEAFAADWASTQVMAKVLEVEKPDLIVLSGDMVSGYAWDKTDGWFEQRWKDLMEPITKAGIPYAATLGNHDAEADLSRRQIVDLDRSSSTLSLTQHGPEGLRGASNYRLPIMSSGGESVAAHVWLLDSMDRGCGFAVFGWGCVGKDTVNWLKAVAANDTSRVPSLAFIHIPVPQFRIMWNVHQTLINGSKLEPVNCPSEESGAFNALRKSGITAVYSGHDHNNDFVGTYHGVRLAYGRKSGYGSYGPPKGWQHGARVIQLREGESTSVSDTWIRLEDGSVHRQHPVNPEHFHRQLFCWPGGWADTLFMNLSSAVSA